MSSIYPDRGRSDRVTGCIVRLAVGDALGAPLEFTPRHEVRRRFPRGLRDMTASALWSKGEYTDDTQMALLIAESLIEKHGFVAADIAGLEVGDIVRYHGAAVRVRHI